MKIWVERIKEDVEALRRISSTPYEGGITRISWTGEYAKGADYIKNRMKEAGLRVWEDALGNVCGLLEGEPGVEIIAAGSHLDTVICSGAYDGVEGVACAMEAVRVLRENGIHLTHSLEILGMIEEEGARTGNVLTGSAYLCRYGENEEIPGLKDFEGRTLEEILARYKREERVPVEEHRAFEKPPKAFIEVHDEQGPVLEQRGLGIGIVRRIRGMISFEVRLRGKGGHPGTVPMDMRRDSGLAAFEACLKSAGYVEREYNDQATLTVGRMKLLPGSGNSIPREAVFSVDIRFASQDIGDRIERQVLGELEEAAKRKDLSVEITTFTRKAPVDLDEKLIRIIREACRDMEEPYLYMDSGAGHDSMNFASICPTAMIFSPCRGGVSHDVQEYVEEKDLEKVTEALVRTIIKIDKEI